MKPCDCTTAEECYGDYPPAGIKCRELPHVEVGVDVMPSSEMLESMTGCLQRILNAWTEFTRDLNVHPGSTAEAQMREMDDAIFAAAQRNSAVSAIGWVECSARMPKSGEYVIAFVPHAHSPEGPSRRLRAFYAERFTIETSSDDDGDWIEYSEEKDEYYLPAGWYECNEYEDNHWHVSDPVTHWMPLPSAPDNCASSEQKAKK